MAQSTTIVAFDQHADSIMAAVFPPDAREPVVQAVAADVEQVGRFVGKLARQGRALAGRQQGQPAPIVQQAWAAQQRLFHRYRRLTGRGKTDQCGHHGGRPRIDGLRVGRVGVLIGSTELPTEKSRSHDASSTTRDDSRL